MGRGLFVTGTDTGVGKTVVSAALMHRYRAGRPLRYWKPIQTGIEHDDDTGEVARLGVCSVDEILDRGIRLPRPVSPHLAARLSGTSIKLADIVEEIDQPRNRAAWIVEGAGGVLVPVNDVETMRDLMVRLSFAVIVVARSVLGTINHTLLTIEALRRSNLTVAGIVMVGEPDADNRAAIEQHGKVAVVGQMPRLDPLTPAVLRDWANTSLDREERLLERLR